MKKISTNQIRNSRTMHIVIFIEINIASDSIQDYYSIELEIFQVTKSGLIMLDCSGSFWSSLFLSDDPVI